MRHKGSQRGSIALRHIPGEQRVPSQAPAREQKKAANKSLFGIAIDRSFPEQGEQPGTLHAVQINKWDMAEFFCQGATERVQRASFSFFLFQADNPLHRRVPRKQRCKFRPGKHDERQAARLMPAGERAGDQGDVAHGAEADGNHRGSWIEHTGSGIQG